MRIKYFRNTLPDTIIPLYRRDENGRFEFWSRGSLWDNSGNPPSWRTQYLRPIDAATAKALKSKLTAKYNV